MHRQGYELQLIQYDERDGHQMGASVASGAEGSVGAVKKGEESKEASSYWRHIEHAHRYWISPRVHSQLDGLAGNCFLRA
jgi:hypothetical protein